MPPISDVLTLFSSIVVFDFIFLARRLGLNVGLSDFLRKTGFLVYGRVSDIYGQSM